MLLLSLAVAHAAPCAATQAALDAENAAEMAANAVLIAMGESPGQTILPATPPGDVPELGELDPNKAVEVALAQNLDLSVARRTLEQSELDVANARHGLLPSLSATASAGVASQRCPPGTEDEDCVVGNALGSLAGLAAEDNQPFVELRGLFSVPLGNRMEGSPIWPFGAGRARQARGRPVAVPAGARRPGETDLRPGRGAGAGAAVRPAAHAARRRQRAPRRGDAVGRRSPGRRGPHPAEGRARGSHRGRSGQGRGREGRARTSGWRRPSCSSFRGS